jgi:hypothetical protein
MPKETITSQVYPTLLHPARRADLEALRIYSRVYRAYSGLVGPPLNLELSTGVRYVRVSDVKIQWSPGGVRTDLSVQLRTHPIFHLYFLFLIGGERLDMQGHAEKKHNFVAGQV